ncbi:MAG: carbamoyltransferase C-terminal domain-containing protein [Candidatus Contendobacter sp.]|nr:carbamoyltransferase C-terminal domain-containing protein [Candidatus Contendobacter sp.]
MKPWIGLNAAMTQDGRRQIDGAVAILLDGKIHSLPQERLSRRKHDGGVAIALHYVLEGFGLDFGDIERFVISTSGEPTPGREAPVHLRPDGRLTLQDLGVEPDRIEWRNSHHESHAFEAIFAARNVGTLSLPALIFVADRVGQPGEHQSYYRFDGNKLELIHRDPAIAGCLNGLGETYDRITRHLGWREQIDAGKTMALAGLANSSTGPDARLFFDCRDGAILSLLPRDEEISIAILARLCPARPAPERLLDEGAALAARLQGELEAAVIAALAPLIGAIRPRILLCGGGLATNCRLLGRLSGAFPDLAVQGSLAPGDTGQGIGNLVAAYFRRFGKLPGEADPLGGFWRKGDGWDFCPQTLDRIPLRGADRHIVPILGDDADADQAANRLAKGDILATMAGVHEPGPRALGFHSLLADARDADLRHVLNAIVKEREAFRPFGAMMEKRAFDRFFGPSPSAAPFMDLALPASPEFKALYPAAIHADGSSRVQVLGRMHEGSFVARLLRVLAEQHGVEAVINTSLNPKAKPILYEAASLADFRQQNFD